eukprot:TRINITY_DN7472_c0_g1_i1.p1 TRINITY_DN7472_c0_g1~~TRINITY_DN7472_c0_g1_i1.p1  ORF type:complete len:592 (-),score=76.57 TRINITY_DN7472_c0_g1_i1:48-1700(-)
MEDWYNVKATDFKTHGYFGILRKYNSSPVVALQAIYGDYEWEPWRFMKVPPNYWNELSNRRKYLDYLAKTLKIKKMSDWYRITLNDIKLNQGSGLIHRFERIYDLLINTFPEYSWNPWKFDIVRVGSLNKEEDQSAFMEYFGMTTNVKVLSEFYATDVATLGLHGGSSLLNQYKRSPSLIFKYVYNYYTWRIWNFHRSPSNTWNDARNVRLKLDEFLDEIHVEVYDGIYTVISADDLKKHVGSLSANFNFSPYRIFSDVYPEFNWSSWKFEKSPHNTHKDKSMSGKFSSQLPFNSFRDTESWSKSDISKLGMIAKESENQFKEIYPEYENLRLDRNRRPDNFWNSNQNLTESMFRLGKLFQIESIDDWYRISGKQLQYFNALGIIKTHGSLFNALVKAFPEHNWDKTKYLNQAKKAAQRWLLLKVKELFPNLTPPNEIIEDHLHYFSDERKSVELDVWIPSLKLAFEYQGEQHFHMVRSKSLTLESYQARDKLKRELCDSEGITLVDVPYWWNGELDTLAYSIYSRRPELQTHWERFSFNLVDSKPVKDL